uniref:C-type lectin domain-containing protein n=1 Tax=Anopheles christyi TaxID=43041 RepID=A0A182JWT7_9DIPT
MEAQFGVTQYKIANPSPYSTHNEMVICQSHFNRQMKHPRIGHLLALLLVTLEPAAYSIVTPYQLVSECVADAPFIVPNFKVYKTGNVTGTNSNIAFTLCFKCLILLQANWFKAVEYCHYLGRALVTIATEQRQHMLNQLLDDASHHPREQSFWCGANDLADVDNFHWHLTGRPVAIGWSNWRDELHRREPVTEPDAFKVRCVSLARTADEVEELQQQQEDAVPPSPPSSPFSWIWTVSNCWKELYFICERTGGVSGCR